MSRSPVDPRTPSLAMAAMASSAVMMSYQVASRATRDTLFLSTFHINSLPLMVAVASVLSIVSALLATRAIATYGPGRVVPATFLGSALLTLGEWALILRHREAGAIVVYLHVAAISPVLFSGFWSIVNEQFDPRTAKREVGRIAALGTLGGLVGGVIAERITAWAGAPTTLPALAVAHACCAWSTYRLPSPRGAAGRSGTQETLAPGEARRRLLSTPYLRNLALLVLGSSVSAALLDFVFKAQATGMTRQSLDLMRLFSAFYALVAIVTFAVQTLFTRASLQRVGLAGTIGVLPGGVAAGGVAAMVVPGPWGVGIARGLEAVLRGSLFRAGYELLYTPIPPAEKRATKTVVDVGCDRLGDAVGAGIIGLVLLLMPTASSLALLAVSVLLAVATLGLVAQLQSGYVRSLEAGLRAGAVDLDQLDFADGTTRIALNSLEIAGAPGAAGALDLSRSIAIPARPRVAPVAPAVSPTAYAVARPPDSADDVTDKLRALRSANPPRARAALRDAPPLDGSLVPQAIQLLASDELAADAVRALVPVAGRHIGQLVDALLDPDSDFAVRRRIPGVLVTSPTSRVVEGLTRGLADGRFEVRYRCGRALSRILERETSLQVDRELILGAVRREATVGRGLWESQRLLDMLEEQGDESFVDDFLRDRAGRSLEHVFTLLSLVLPREPLQIAFRGLFAGDPMLRGTALEYLESVLPSGVREVLWPYLEPDRASRRVTPPAPRDREQVLSDLLRSNQSIEINLEMLRRHRREEPGSGLGT